MPTFLPTLSLRYEIRIKGHIGRSLLSSFDDMESAMAPAETVLRGEIVDQAQLHGLIEHSHLLGLELLEVRKLPGSDEQAVTGG